VGADLARPFVGNVNAPATSVGIFAGDACNFFGSSCALAPNQLVTFSQDVQSGSNGSPVQQNAVRYIINASTAQSIFGTPFGARRNLYPPGCFRRVFYLRRNQTNH